VSFKKVALILLALVLSLASAILLGGFVGVIFYSSQNIGTSVVIIILTISLFPQFRRLLRV